MGVLGDRPYPLKESIKEYLQELERRKAEESVTEEIDAAQQAMTSEDTSSATEEVKEDRDKSDVNESSNIDDVNNKK